MKKSLIAVAATAVALTAGSVFVPSAAYAVASTVSWSPSTICPGETTTLTINGQTTGDQLVPSGGSAEYWELFADGNPGPFSVTSPGSTYSLLNSNPIPYSYFSDNGATSSVQFQVQNGTAPGILNEATITLLAVCASPAPDASADKLPDTGFNGSALASFAGYAAMVGLAGGALIAARNRRIRASK